MKESIKRLKSNRNVRPAAKPDLSYVEDQEGAGISEFNGLKRPKWQTPVTDFQKSFLEILNRKYYAYKNERSALIAIEKSMLSLATGLISIYPTEWVETSLNWARKKRQDGFLIPFKGVINLINDKERKEQFVISWQRKHPEIALKKQITDVYEPKDGRNSAL